MSWCTTEWFIIQNTEIHVSLFCTLLPKIALDELKLNLLTLRIAMILLQKKNILMTFPFHQDMLSLTVSLGIFLITNCLLVFFFLFFFIYVFCVAERVELSHVDSPPIIPTHTTTSKCKYLIMIGLCYLLFICTSMFVVTWTQVNMGYMS